MNKVVDVKPSGWVQRVTQIVTRVNKLYRSHTLYRKHIPYYGTTPEGLPPSLVVVISLTPEGSVKDSKSKIKSILDYKPTIISVKF